MPVAQCSDVGTRFPERRSTRFVKFPRAPGEDDAIGRVAVETMDVVGPGGAAAAGMTSCWRVWRGRLGGEK